MTEELAGPMELFLMAAIARGGLTTLYAFQRKADLEPGSIRKVIAALQMAGLLVRSNVATSGRRRRTMALTEVGKRFLEERWKNSMQEKREMESILRSATVALLMEDIGAAIVFLGQAAFDRRKNPGSQVFGAASLESTPIDLHAAMRNVYDGRRREIEADVLLECRVRLMELAKNRAESKSRGLN
jgi:DNA-binding MarR family transcriptional regulator